MVASGIPEGYLKERELKRSERGTIFLLRHRSGGERRILRCYDGAGEAYERLLGLDCENLPWIESVCRQNGRVEILEEYVQGDRLDFLLEGGCFDTALTRSVAEQVCTALEALHSRGVVHRDVKPENILLRGSQAVLIDFDVSRVKKEYAKGDTMVMGTTGYAAPEQYGFAQTDARADIYSVGVLMNVMLTGQHPSLRLAEGELRPVIEKCIEVNVDKRFASAKELRRALLEPPVPGGKSHWKTVAIGLAAIALATLLAILWRPWAPVDRGSVRLNAVTGSEVPEEQTLSGTDPVSGEQSSPMVKPAATAEPTFVDYSSPEILPVMLKEDLELLELRTDEIPTWTRGDENGATMFEYDLDGDGIAEEYVFGALCNLPDVQPTGGGVDTFGVNSDVTVRRNYAPAVWTLYGDAYYVPVEEFGDLLEDPCVTVWRKTVEGQKDPSIWESEDAYGCWRGTVSVFFSDDAAGEWVIESTAWLDGIELRAVSVALAR